MDTRQRRGLSRSPSASISPQSDNTLTNKGCGVRSYGFPRRGVRGNFVPPIRGSSGNNVGNVSSRNAGKGEDTLDDSTRRWLVDLACFISVYIYFELTMLFNSSYIALIYLIKDDWQKIEKGAS